MTCQARPGDGDYMVATEGREGGHLYTQETKQLQN